MTQRIIETITEQDMRELETGGVWTEGMGLELLNEVKE